MTLYEAAKANNEPNLMLYKVKIPPTVKQLTATPIQEGWIAMLHVNGTGLFMSPDDPGSKNRKLIATYPETRKEILEWEVVPHESKTQL